MNRMHLNTSFQTKFQSQGSASRTSEGFIRFSSMARILFNAKKIRILVFIPHLQFEMAVGAFIFSKPAASRDEVGSAFNVVFSLVFAVLK